MLEVGPLQSRACQPYGAIYLFLAVARTCAIPASLCAFDAAPQPLASQRALSDEGDQRSACESALAAQAAAAFRTSFSLRLIGTN